MFATHSPSRLLFADSPVSAQEIAKGELLWLRPVLAPPQEIGRHYQDLVLREP